MSRQPEASVRAEAYEQIQPKLKERHLEVLRLLASGPNTGSGLAAISRIELLTIRPRLVELRDMGLIEPTGRRVPNDRGKNETEYQLKEKNDDEGYGSLFDKHCQFPAPCSCSGCRAAFPSRFPARR